MIERLKTILHQHTFLFSLLLLVLLFAGVINFIVGHDRAVLFGEYVFSFDYREHLSNIITDFWSDDPLLRNSQECETCLSFYHYSRWYSFFKLGVYSIGEFLGFNAFVFLLFLSAAAQISALYIFTRVHFNEFVALPFLVSAYIFGALPIRFALLGESNEGITYSLFVLFFALAPVLWKKLGEFSRKQFWGYSLLFGLYCGFFMNISISHLPLFLYLMFGTIVFAYSRWRMNWQRLLIFLLIGGMVALIINLPFVWSVFAYPRTKIFTTFHSFQPLDAFGLFTVYAGTHESLAYVLLLVLGYMLLISDVAWKRKLILAGVYFLMGIFIMGVYAPLPIYEWIFRHVFLMDTIRATHKFLPFQLIIAFYVLYSGLTKLWMTKSIYSKGLFVLFTAFLIWLPVQHINVHYKDLAVLRVPVDYFQVDAYFKDRHQKKIYFPHTFPTHQSMLGHYTWTGLEKPRLLYKNPFSSLFALRNIVTFEHYPYPPEVAQLQALTDFSVNPDEIVRALEFSGVEYVIIDKHYAWNSAYVPFDIDRLMEIMPLEKQFGSIYIYRLANRSHECTPAYGNYRLGYCFNKNEFSHLISKGLAEYQLERMLDDHAPQIIEPDAQSRFPAFVQDPTSQFLAVRHKLYIPRAIYTIEGRQERAFVEKIDSQNDYVLLVGVMHNPVDEPRFLDIALDVYVNDSLVHSLSPFAQTPHYVWHQFSLPQHLFNSPSSELRLAISPKKNGGFVVMSPPLLFSQSEWDTLQRDWNEKSNSYTMIE